MYVICTQHISLLFPAPHKLLSLFRSLSPASLLFAAVPTKICACASTRARPPSSAPRPPWCGSFPWPFPMESCPPGTAHKHRRAFMSFFSTPSPVFTCIESHLCNSLCTCTESRLCNRLCTCAQLCDNYAHTHTHLNTHIHTCTYITQHREKEYNNPPPPPSHSPPLLEIYMYI